MRDVSDKVHWEVHVKVDEEIGTEVNNIEVWGKIWAGVLDEIGGKVVWKVKRSV